MPVKTQGRTEPVDMATAKKVAELGKKPMSVRDQLSKLRPRVRTGLSERSVEHKPLQVQRKRSQQARYQALALVEAHIKEQRSCGGLKPCGTFRTVVSEAGAARVAAAMGGPGALQTARSLQVPMRHRSGVVKMYPELDPQSRQSRSQMRKEDPRIIAARLKIEGASIRTSTSSKYSSQWKEYVAHSEDCASLVPGSSLLLVKHLGLP